MKHQSPFISTVIIRPGAIGDTLMLMPALSQLSNSNSIAVVGRRPGIDFLLGIVGSVMDMDEARWHVLFSKAPGSEDLPFEHAANVMAFLSKPDPQVKSNLHFHYRRATINIFPALPLPEHHRHVAWHVAQCFKEAGLEVDPDKAMDAACSAPLIKVQGDKPGAYYVVHPGSGSREKNYPPEFFVNFVSGLSFLSLEPVILLGPAEEGLVQDFQSGPNCRSLKVVVCPSREELVSLLTGSQFYIGHDSGITHLSAMLGRFTIALFKTTSIKHWRPLGPQVYVIEGSSDERMILNQALELACEIIA